MKTSEDAILIGDMFVEEDHGQYIAAAIMHLYLFLDF